MLVDFCFQFGVLAPQIMYIISWDISTYFEIRGKFFLIFLLLLLFFTLNIVLILPYINMNPPWVYMCSPSWTPLPLPTPYHPSGSSQCTSPKLPVSCIEPGLAIHFFYDIIHVLMPRKLWYIYTMEYYSAIKKNTFESVPVRWMKLEPIIQSEVSQKEKHQYNILTHIHGI